MGAKREEEFRKLFEEHVPMTGMADSLAGELVRAANRIEYRNWNDGDHIGVGYGNETCNAPARFLQTYGDENVASIVGKMWGVCGDALYDGLVEMLLDAVVGQIEKTPALFEVPAKDMWSFRKDEDYDYEDEDDEYWDDEQDEDDWEDEE